MCGEERGGGIINQSLQPESGTAEQIKDNHPLRSKTETEPMANGLSTPSRIRHCRTNQRQPSTKVKDGDGTHGQWLVDTKREDRHNIGILFFFF
jgi:hypothetical protein